MGLAAIAGIAILVSVIGGDEPADNWDANFSAFGLADDPYLGNPDGDVIVVAFEAPRCSACKSFHAGTLPFLKETYLGDNATVGFYYSQYHISPEDFSIGIMQECAFKHGGNPAFWDLTGRIYGPGPDYPSTNQAQAWMEQTGDAFGIRAELDSCHAGKDTSKKVSADYRIGDDYVPIGTPTFWVFGPQGEAIMTSSNGLIETIDFLLAQS